MTLVLFAAASAVAAITIKDQHPLQSRPVAAAMTTTRPATTTAPPATTTRHCTLVEVIFESHLGSPNATGSSYIACDCNDTVASRYHLEVSSATEKLQGFGSLDRVTLVLAEQTQEEEDAAGSEQKRVRELTGRPKFHRVLEARVRELNDRPKFHRVREVRSHTVADRQMSHANHTVAASLLGDGNYFAGEVRIKLLSVIVTTNGHTADYAGSTTAQRELWAAETRRIMDVEYRWSTYGKIGFDAANSIVRTIDIGNYAVSSSDCSAAGFGVAQRAATQLAAEFRTVDAVMYYLPWEAIRPACENQAWGMCYSGVLKPRNRFRVEGWCPAHMWEAGCWVGNQQSWGVGGVVAEAQVSTHEFGHHLSLMHAGGTHAGGSGRPVRSASGPLNEYGDQSAIMGNDAMVANAMTASSRYFLGVLPRSAVASSDAAPVKLKTLEPPTDLPWSAMAAH